MASNTTRAGFILPTTLEPRAIGPINSNFTRNDELLGAFLINDGATIPDAQAIDGMIVKEKTSGKMWVLQKNVGGTFDRKYIRYPWSFTGYTTDFASGNGWGNYGFLNYGGSSGAGGAGYGPVNSSAADLVGSVLVLPVTGIYSLVASIRWNPTAVANTQRAAYFNFSQTYPVTPGAGANGPMQLNTGMQGPANSPGNHTQLRLSCAEQFPAGQKVSIDAYQDTGGALNATYVIFAALLEPTA